MRYKVMAAAAGLFLLAGCDDPKPSSDVGAASQQGGPSAQPVTAGEQMGNDQAGNAQAPGNTMMMQSGANSGNAKTMQQGSAMQSDQNAPRRGPDGEPLAGTQPLNQTDAPPRQVSPVPGQN